MVCIAWAPLWTRLNGEAFSAPCTDHLNGFEGRFAAGKEYGKERKRSRGKEGTGRGGFHPEKKITSWSMCSDRGWAPTAAVSK